MAQYKRNFYGTSYYGETNAFSGTYLTGTIISDEVLNGSFQTEMKVLLPIATYKHGDEDLIIEGNYEETETGLLLKKGAKIRFYGSLDRFLVFYQAEAGAGNSILSLTKSGDRTDYVIDGTQGEVLDVQNIEYGQYEAVIEVTGNSLLFKEIRARVTHFTLESRARIDEGTWSEWSKIDLEESTGQLAIITLSGESIDYKGKNQIQLRFWMASSDYGHSPEILYARTYAGDTMNRTGDALWVAEINMANLASAAGQTFKEIRSVKWTSSEPKDTSIRIRTRTTSDASRQRWNPWSVPYEKEGRRIRLKEGLNQGHLITPLINPAAINPHLRIAGWDNWNDRSYFPQDATDVKIRYDFLDEKNEVLYSVTDPRTQVDRNLTTAGLSNKPFRIKISLSRRFDKESPVVSNLSLISEMIYEESKVFEDVPFSAVENNNTGVELIVDMSTLTFTPPAEARAPIFYLEDKTDRPLDVSLFYESQRNEAGTLSISNQTQMPNDKVFARTKEYVDESGAGVRKHYQYGGGTAMFGKKDEEIMPSAFSPSLNETKLYRYYLINGWYSATEQNVIPDSLNSNVKIAWKTEDDLTLRTNLTSKSSHNAIIESLTDLSGDAVIGEVLEESTWEEVDWVSEEKVYFGRCNLNNIHEDYIRLHETPESGDSLDTKYIAQIGDTYESVAAMFGIDEEDLRETNQDEGTLRIGSEILVPSRIVLPAIDPHVTVGVSPYEIQIVYNSVRQGTRVVPDDRIVRARLNIIEKEVLIEKEEVIRGSILNGKDFLQNPLVSEIVGIWTLPNDPVLAPNYQSGLDYTLTNGQVNWSPVAVNSREPQVGSKYYVSYKCKKPTAVQVIIGSDYQEESGIDRIWRSPEVKIFKGVCQPGQDYVATLPPVEAWLDSNNPEVKEIEYMIEDNDLWVKTWVDFDEREGVFKAHGSLQDRIPKDNWFPTIQAGYYYLGKKEHFLFSEPITYSPKDQEIPKARNISYVKGLIDNAASFEESSMNLVRNSGFEVPGAVSTVYWRGFNSQTSPTGQGVSELGK